ncbi:Rme1p NDAI_0D04090 [Naumovozyma dairenensis CBS 421]|uniref:C2H2-type domain-containing protein n=1 Tax=Naumovozyma dairenensis (strain ATCC 10597 / BCRC 20456 / CBS 421 / NBRC 0211 / NRRL Y-12639) TaxID=1071378 RepID=G0WAB2_NAUDC|nr:hypothetical protein NDAI_0D04090 [Naumovozyma dairenensis CBS 421]CCD24723.1 hypothetical protein NDAI_0D04090 [Naumovozyma dairenensis CBS 421]
MAYIGTQKKSYSKIENNFTGTNKVSKAYLPIEEYRMKHEPFTLDSMVEHIKLQELVSYEDSASCFRYLDECNRKIEVEDVFKYDNNRTDSNRSFMNESIFLAEMENGYSSIILDEPHCSQNCQQSELKNSFNMVPFISEPHFEQCNTPNIYYLPQEIKKETPNIQINNTANNVLSLPKVRELKRSTETFEDPPFFEPDMDFFPLLLTPDENIFSNVSKNINTSGNLNGTTNNNSGNNVTTNKSLPQQLENDPNYSLEARQVDEFQWDIFLTPPTTPDTQTYVNQLKNDKPLLKALSKKHKRGSYRCAHCPSMFGTIFEYAAHMDEFEIKREFKCPFRLCPWKILGLPRRSDLRRHCAIQHKHELPESLKEELNLKDEAYPSTECPNLFCEKEFYRKDALNRHIAIVHEKENSRFNKRLKKLYEECAYIATEEGRVAYIREQLLKDHKTKKKNTSSA